MDALRSLRARLLAVYLGLIIVGFGGLTLWAGRQIANATLDDFGNNVRILAISTASQLAEPLEDRPDNAAAVLQAAARSLDAEVTLYDENGRFLTSTTPQQTPLINTETYELTSAYANEPTVYASSAVLYEGATLGIVQLGVSAVEVETAVRQRWLLLGAGFAIFSLLGVVVSTWLLTTLTRPLTDLRQTALRMADGNLSERVTNPPQDEIGEVGLAFNQMAERVEAMMAEQRAFASNASHELRTPLTTVRLRTEALRHETLDEAIQAQYIAEIDSEVQQMGRLVEDLLMLSRLDAKQLPIGNAAVDAGRVLAALEQQFAPRFAEKGVTLTVDHPAQPVIARANATHLRVVYRNVLDNGLKYTAAGSVTAVLNQTATVAQLRVTDTGEGISAEDLPQVGNRFFRADKAHSRTIVGTGLGLAMARSILELYGGSLQVESDGVGLGTAVTVEWPLA